jgi:hypothetical protein
VIFKQAIIPQAFLLQIIGIGIPHEQGWIAGDAGTGMVLTGLYEGHHSGRGPVSVKGLEKSSDTPP